MKNYLAGFATAYLAGAIGATAATLTHRHMDLSGMTVRRAGIGVVVAAIWPYYAYVAVNEWNG